MFPFFRTPRPEERNGVDYTFLSKEEFLALEKSGDLLESGVYEGKLFNQNHSNDSEPWFLLEKCLKHFLLKKF